MNNSSKLSKTVNLRQKAETLLRINSSETGSPLSEIETLKLVHELEVHQIELELINEELMLANSAAQEAAKKYTELFDFAPSGYFTLSKEGTVIDLNFSGAKMLCKKCTDLKNCNFTFFVSNDTKPIFYLFLSKVFNSKTEESCEVILSVNDNLPMYVYINGIVTENGEQCHVNVMNITDQKLADELTIANKELAFQNEEKEKRAAELIIANKELAFQNKEKEKRANELIIANKELAFQNKEKEKRAAELVIVNKAFLQSEENFRRSISESPLGIRIISIEGEIIYVNKAFLDIYELNSLEEFRSIPSINRYTPESYAQHQIRKEKIKNGHDIFDYEQSIIRGNAEVRYLKVWRKEILWNGVKHYQVINIDITERKLAEEALNNSQQELRKFASHLQNVREEEKLSLAREIHDDLGQILVALKIDLGMLERKLSKGIEATTSEELLSKFNDLSGQVDKTIKSARRIMNGLRPELIELLGFEEACKSYLRDFEETHHISSLFESAILNLNINLEQSVALFRILQEALTNVAKHAKATLVTVQLTNPAGKLVLQIIDNGVGFDENNKGRQDSYGMIGMKERVILLEGELFITSKVGKGTSVRVEIPYSS